MNKQIQCAILQSESRRGSAISLFLSGRKKKWPSLFGGKNKRRGRADDDGYGSEIASDLRLKEFDQVNSNCRLTKVVGNTNVGRIPDFFYSQALLYRYLNV